MIIKVIGNQELLSFCVHQLKICIPLCYEKDKLIKEFIDFKTEPDTEQSWNKLLHLVPEGSSTTTYILKNQSAEEYFENYHSF